MGGAPQERGRDTVGHLVSQVVPTTLPPLADSTDEDRGGGILEAADGGLQHGQQGVRHATAGRGSAKAGTGTHSGRGSAGSRASEGIGTASGTNTTEEDAGDAERESSTSTTLAANDEQTTTSTIEGIGQMGRKSILARTRAKSHAAETWDFFMCHSQKVCSEARHTSAR